MKLPEEYLNNMKELLKDEYDSFLNSYEDHPQASLRINTNKISVKDFLNINPFDLTPIPWTDDGFYYSDADKPTKHPYYFAGLYYIQEASAMLPAQVLPIEENDIVLDACAAPGGKSLKIANKFKDTGILFSNDISISRAQVLLKNLESHGVANMIVMAEDLNSLDQFDSYFDKILLDAPCSGEGMFRKEPELIKSWLEKGNDYYADIQKQLITKAYEMLKPGGMMVYSTCTFSIKEDEEVIEHLLSLHDDIEILPIKHSEGFSHGYTKNTTNCIRLFPHKIKGEGHFISLIHKKGNIEDRRSIQHIKADRPQIDFFGNINHDFPDGQFISRNDKLYFQRINDPKMEKLRILRNGLYMGEMKHERFEPSQALASYLKVNQFNNVLNFDLNDDRVIKYLKCETLDVKDRYMNGYVLVCVENFPLGFGIVNKGILKNKYPANYRYK